MPAVDVNARDQIDALFSPRRVVVVGASTDRSRVSGRPLTFLRDWGFEGDVAVVNPRRDEVLGQPSFPSVTDVPFAPDLAILCVGADRVLESLAQCAERGVRAAVVFAAGFAEIDGGCPDEPAIHELATRSGMAVCGPNCLGTISVDDRVPATFSTVLTEATLRSGDVALVTQSGALGMYLYAEAARRGIGFSRWVSTGNETVLAAHDYIEWLAHDERTRVICAYVEGVRDGVGFRRALDAAGAAGKPVIVLKGGQSQSGARGVESHTGAIAGDATVFSGVLASAGAHEVTDASELLELASLVRIASELPADRGLGMTTTSGGGGILVADWLTRSGLRLATLARDTIASIEPVIPAFGRAENPVDVTGNLMNDPAMVRVTAELLARDPDVAAVIAYVGVGGETADRVVDELLAVELPAGCPMAVIWMGASEPVRQRLGEGGIALFGDIGPCVRAFAAIWQRSPRQRAPEVGGPATDGAARAAGAERQLIQEHEVKARLAELGLPVPRGELVTSDGAQELMLEPALRYAVKGQAPGVAHKAARGLVRLDCAAGDVSAACRTIAAAAAEQELRLDGLLVEEMAPAGVELLVTLRDDPTFGWTLLVGAGGALVELLSDVVARPCPLTEREAARALDALDVASRFDELSDPATARMRAVDALVDVALAAGRLPTGVVEVELNPVMVSAERAMIADAIAFSGPR